MALERLRQRIATWLVGKATPEEWFRDFGFGEVESATGLHINQRTAMQAGAVMACVSIRSEDVAKLPCHVFRRETNGGKTVQTDHPVERLLQRPNDWQTPFEFKEQMGAAYLLRGNAYAAIVRDGRGVPRVLVPINPDWVSLYQATDGSLFYQVARNGPHLMAALASLPLMVPAEDMLHLRWLSFDGLVGLSRIGYAREAIGLSLAQQEQASRFVRNGARPSGALQTEQKLTPESIKNLKESWADLQGGIANTGKIAVFEAGLKWQPLGMTSVDAEFLASRGFQLQEIARIFRMPGHKLGVVDKSTNATMAQADQDYFNNVIATDAERWEEKIEQTFDLDRQSLFIEFDFSRFLRADMQARFNGLRAGVAGMILTPNEARRSESLPDVEGGDLLYQPTNVAPLGFSPTGTETGPGSDFTGAPAPGGDGDPAAVPEA